MKNVLAIGLACCIPIGLAAEDSKPPEADLGTMNVLMVDDSAQDCVHAPDEKAGNADCISSFNHAVLTARIQKVSVLRERGRWL